jgi:hypothetical protein
VTFEERKLLEAEEELTAARAKVDFWSRRVKRSAPEKEEPLAKPEPKGLALVTTEEAATVGETHRRKARQQLQRYGI